jgi:hypothetical protein
MTRTSNLGLNFAGKPGNKRRLSAGGCPSSSGSACTMHCSSPVHPCNPLRCTSAARSPGACPRQLNQTKTEHYSSTFSTTKFSIELNYADWREQGRVLERSEPWKGWRRRASIAAPSCCGCGWGGGSWWSARCSTAAATAPPKPPASPPQMGSIAAVRRVPGPLPARRPNPNHWGGELPRAGETEERGDSRVTPSVSVSFREDGFSSFRRFQTGGGIRIVGDVDAARGAARRRLPLGLEIRWAREVGAERNCRCFVGIQPVELDLGSGAFGRVGFFSFLTILRKNHK